MILFRESESDFDRRGYVVNLNGRKDPILRFQLLATYIWDVRLG